MAIREIPSFENISANVNPTSWYQTVSKEILGLDKRLLQYLHNIFRDREINFGFELKERARQAAEIADLITDHYAQKGVDPLFSPGKILDLAYHEFQEKQGYEDPSRFNANFFEQTVRF